MSDVIVVMRDGRIQQQGQPEELYERPVNRFVADFIGSSNFLTGKLVGVDAATRVATVEIGSGLQITRPPHRRRRQPRGGDGGHRRDPARGRDRRAGDRRRRRRARRRADPGRGPRPPGHLPRRHDRVPGPHRAAGELVVRRQNIRDQAASRAIGPGEPVVAQLARGGQPDPVGLRRPAPIASNRGPWRRRPQMDEALRRYQQDIARAQISRRRFMTIAALGGASAALAACGGQQRHGGPDGGRVVGGLGRAVGRARGVAPAKRPAPPRRPRSRPRKTRSSCSTGRTTSPTTTRRVRDEVQRRRSPTTPTRRTRSCSRSSRPAARASTTSPSRPPSSRRRWPTPASSHKLDKSRLPNLTKVNERFLTLPFDPNDDYIVPKDWGTTGIIYRGSREGAGDVVEGLLRPRQGQVLGQDRSSSTRPATCSSRRCGCSASTSTPTDPSELEIARQELLALRPHLQSLDSDTYPDTLRNGDAVLALAWNGTAYLMQQEADYKDTGYTVPSEGTIYWIDTWVMLDQAPAPERGLRVPQLDPGAGHPGHREPVRRLRELQRRGEGAPAARVRRTTRPSTCRRSSWRTCRCPPTRAATSSAPTSGPSSSLDDRRWRLADGEHVDDRGDRAGSDRGAGAGRAGAPAGKSGGAGGAACSRRCCCCRPASGTSSLLVAADR